MMSRIATTMTVVSNSVTLAPSNTAAMSTSNPSGPVSRAVSPPGRSSDAEARSSAARSACVSRFASIWSGTVTNATVPSSEMAGGGTKPSGVKSARLAAAAVTASTSASVNSSPSRSKTISPTVESLFGKPSRRASAMAESADAGSPTAGAASLLLPEPAAKRAPAISTAPSRTIQEVRAAVMK